MKRLVLVLALVLLAGVVFAQDFEYDSALGWGEIGYAWRVHTDDSGAVTRLQAVNWALGYTDKRYFEPVSVGSFNLWWGWGTVSVLVPWIGIGGDYYVNEQLYIGASFPFGLTLGYYL